MFNLPILCPVFIDSFLLNVTIATGKLPISIAPLCITTISYGSSQADDFAAGDATFEGKILTHAKPTMLLTLVNRNQQWSSELLGHICSSIDWRFVFIVSLQDRHYEQFPCNLFEQQAEQYLTICEDMRTLWVEFPAFSLHYTMFFVKTNKDKILWLRFNR